MTTRKHPRSKVARRPFCVFHVNVQKFERKQCELFETTSWLSRWCIISPSSTQTNIYTFRNRFSDFCSSIHANITHIYMFWTSSYQIVQMMRPILHDLVCIFCFLGILVKNVTYTQCKTAKPVSKHAHFVTDRHTHTHEHTQIWGSPAQKALRAIMRQ